MKKLILLIILLVIPVVYGMDECESPIEPSELPCMVITAYQYPNPCNTYSVKIFKDAELINERNLDSYGTSSRCNMTFNYTTAGNYILNLSSGDSASILVQSKNTQYYLYIVGLIIIISLIVIGYMVKEGIFTILGGMLTIVMAVYLWINGFPNLADGLLKTGITIVLAGIGFYFVIAPSLEYLEG